ncbi:MAG TPA: tetratricopeptide repeat protein [Thermoanaerobaculia bacterium]|nr:tetratricopeptide repeat protein [Thermoanaerobaculia bacterium]
MRPLLLLLTIALIGLPLRANDYVADAACASCHASKYASYQGVGMAQSMRRPRAEVLIEDFRKAHFVHQPSRCHYEMAWKDGKLLFRRYQIDAGGQRINFIEQQVDWIVGSGHRSRVYLYRTPSGELYQLPIAWYTQEHTWGMAPGYDRADNDGITRPVRRECLFCHNAYPDVPAGSDAHWMPQRYPAALPEGTGCQRCHGPGADHVQMATSGESNAAVRAAIVNPARLPPALRDSVCFQCHLQPAVAMIGVRRFDRGDYSFRPGEALGDYMLHVDIDEPGRPRGQRFEINHHAYRLRQSLCYIKGGITCISCHDPHQPLKKDPRLANVVSVCLSCHQRHTESNDCVRCHMPSRRAQDVVHVVMTDHRIQRRPPPGDLVAPLAEHESNISDVELLNRTEAPDGTLSQLYRAVTVLRIMPRNADATRYLATHLDATPSLVPRFDLVAVLLQQRQFRRALDLIRILGDAANNDPRLRDWRGSAEIGVGSTTEGLADLHAAMDAEPEIPEYPFNLAAVLHRTGRDAEALPPLTRAIELRPNFVAAWIMRAETLTALGRRSEAIADLHRALAVDPRQSRAYVMLADLLKESGEPGEAERWRKQGERIGSKRPPK